MNINNNKKNLKKPLNHGMQQRQNSPVIQQQLPQQILQQIAQAVARAQAVAQAVARLPFMVDYSDSVLERQQNLPELSQYTRPQGMPLAPKLFLQSASQQQLFCAEFEANLMRESIIEVVETEVSENIRSKRMRLAPELFLQPVPERLFCAEFEANLMREPIIDNSNIEISHNPRSQKISESLEPLPYSAPAESWLFSESGIQQYASNEEFSLQLMQEPIYSAAETETFESLPLEIIKMPHMKNFHYS